MIEKMEKIFIYCMRNQSAGIMEELIKCGAVQQEKVQAMLPDETVRKLASGESIDISEELDLLGRIDDCIAVLKPLFTKKGLYRKRHELTYEELTDQRSIIGITELCDDIEGVVKELDDLEKERKEAEFRKASLIPWQTMDLSSEDMETSTCRVACYILKDPGASGDIIEAAERKRIALYAEEIYSEKDNHYIAVIYFKNEEKKAKDAIGESGAREVFAGNSSALFSNSISYCDSEINRISAEIELKKKLLEQMANRIEELQIASDMINVRMQVLSGREKLMHTDKVDIISGWLPEARKADVSHRLERYACCCEFIEPDKDEDFPVLIKNRGIIEPFGVLTEMYSMPSPRSIDTNWAIGLFFFIFFGMMLSDAGYGIVLAAAGLLGAAFLDTGYGMKRLMRMIGISGISAIFWGALYGSWFGDGISVAAETFFGRTVEIPMLIDPLNEPMKVLIISCIFGIIHLFTGMGIKAYIMIKRGDLAGALFDVGLWYMFLTGLPMLLAPGALGTAGKVMSITGALGLVLTQGRHKPTLMGKITSGVISLYNVTSYFSDVLSYSRILALGLATGVIANVVNILASMAGSSIAGIIFFIIIFVFGHSLNLAINALGAYVHAARLQYVEFFGKYYEGGGIKFAPLEIKTEYVKVTEEK